MWRRPRKRSHCLGGAWSIRRGTGAFRSRNPQHGGGTRCRSPGPRNSTRKPRRDTECARSLRACARGVRTGAHHLAARVRQRYPEPRVRADRDWAQLSWRKGMLDARIAPLEGAQKIRQAKEPDPSKRAETSFALARAIWAAGHDRGRARVLAESAKVDFTRAGIREKELTVERWLRDPNLGPVAAK